MSSVQHEGPKPRRINVGLGDLETLAERLGGETTTRPISSRPGCSRGLAQAAPAGGGPVGAVRVLGSMVSSAPPGPIDRAALALRGHGVPLAVVLTEAATLPVYVGVCAALLVFGFIRRDWLLARRHLDRHLVAGWQTSDFFKLVFARPRHGRLDRDPRDLVLVPERPRDPIGRVLWALGLLFAASGHGRRPGSSAAWLLVAFILAVGWARLALGAHYLSDLAGGYLLGSAFAALALAATGALAGSRAPA